jgi:hypothetical protein
VKMLILAAVATFVFGMPITYSTAGHCMGLTNADAGSGLHSATDADQHWVGAAAAVGGCPVDRASIHLFYSDCLSDADPGAVSVFGVR